MTPPAQIDGPEWVRALVAKWREESVKETAAGCNKEWAEWVRDRHMATASTLRLCAAELEAAAPQPKAEGWRDIASAPEFGDFLVNVRGTVFSAYRYGGEILADYSNKPFANAPTHWIPKPTPPATEGADHG